MAKNLSGIYLDDIPFDLFLKYFNDGNLSNSNKEILYSNGTSLKTKLFKIEVNNNSYYCRLPYKTMNAETIQYGFSWIPGMNPDLELEINSDSTVFKFFDGTTLKLTFNVSVSSIEDNELQIYENLYGNLTFSPYSFFRKKDDTDLDITSLSGYDLENSRFLAKLENNTISSYITNDSFSLSNIILKEIDSDNLIEFNVYSENNEFLGILVKNSQYQIAETDAYGNQLYTDIYGNKSVYSQTPSIFLNHKKLRDEAFYRAISDSSIVSMFFSQNSLGLVKSSDSYILTLGQKFQHKIGYKISTSSPTNIKDIEVPPTILKKLLNNEVIETFENQYLTTNIQSLNTSIKQAKAILLSNDFYEIYNPSNYLELNDNDLLEIEKVYKKTALISGASFNLDIDNSFSLDYNIETYYNTQKITPGSLEYQISNNEEFFSSIKFPINVIAENSSLFITNIKPSSEYPASFIKFNIIKDGYNYYAKNNITGTIQIRISSETDAEGNNILYGTLDIPSTIILKEIKDIPEGSIKEFKFENSILTKFTTDYSANNRFGTLKKPFESLGLDDESELNKKIKDSILSPKRYAESLYLGKEFTLSTDEKSASNTEYYSSSLNPDIVIEKIETFIKPFNENEPTKGDYFRNIYKRISKAEYDALTENKFFKRVGTEIYYFTKISNSDFSGSLNDFIDLYLKPVFQYSEDGYLNGRGKLIESSIYSSKETIARDDLISSFISLGTNYAPVLYGLNDEYFIKKRIYSNGLSKILESNITLTQRDSDIFKSIDDIDTSLIESIYEISDEEILPVISQNLNIQVSDYLENNPYEELREFDQFSYREKRSDYFKDLESKNQLFENIDNSVLVRNNQTKTTRDFYEKRNYKSDMKNNLIQALIDFSEINYSGDLEHDSGLINYNSFIKPILNQSKEYIIDNLTENTTKKFYNEGLDDSEYESLIKDIVLDSQKSITVI